MNSANKVKLAIETAKNKMRQKHTHSRKTTNLENQNPN